VDINRDLGKIIVKDKKSILELKLKMKEAIKIVEFIYN
jgi:hypothetical protein